MVDRHGVRLGGHDGRVGRHDGYGGLAYLKVL